MPAANILNNDIQFEFAERRPNLNEPIPKTKEIAKIVKKAISLSASILKVIIKFIFEDKIQIFLINIINLLN